MMSLNRNTCSGKVGDKVKLSPREVNRALRGLKKVFVVQVNGNMGRNERDFVPLVDRK